MVDENLPANAGGHGFDAWSRKIPYALWGSLANALQLLSPPETASHNQGAHSPQLLRPARSRAHEPQLLKPTRPRACAPQREKPLRCEACTPHLEERPLLAAARESQGANEGDFPGGPVVKTLPCNVGDEASIPGRGTKSHLPWNN